MTKTNVAIDPKKTPKERGKRARQLRLMAGFATRQAVEDRFDISANTLSTWEDGKRGGLTAKGALRIIYAMRQAGWHCTRDWLLYGEGMPPQPIGENLTGNGDNELALDFDEETAIRNELLTFRKYNPDSIDMRVMDDGMLPEYSVGEYIGGQRLFNETIADCINEDCIVETASDELLFRRLKAGSKPTLYTLYCSNPHATTHLFIIEDVKLKSAAPIIWHRKRRHKR